MKIKVQQFRTLLICLLTICAMLTGCAESTKPPESPADNQQDNQVNQDNTESENQVETPSQNSGQEANLAWEDFLTSGDYLTYIENYDDSDKGEASGIAEIYYDDALVDKATLQYAIADLNADSIPELLLESYRDMPFFFTWVFTRDHDDIVLADGTYGYGSYRYSPEQNAVLGSPEVKPSLAIGGSCPFYKLDGIKWEFAFSVGNIIDTSSGEEHFFVSDGTSSKDITEEERDAYFQDAVDFDWKPLP